MEAVLFLIGMNELGQMPQRKKWSKEQKQDLMHIAVCTLLGLEGYYVMTGKDADGWPQFEKVKAVAAEGVKSQERLLQECAIRYFEL